MRSAAKVYIGLVAIGGVVGLAYGMLSLPPSESLKALALLVILCGVAQATSVPLFSGSSVSIAFAVSFISLLLFGPAGAILANLGSAIVHALYPKRRAWYKIVFNAGVFTISAAASGATYAVAGGEWPVEDLMSSAVPAASAALVYFLVNTIAVSLAVSLTTGAGFRKVFNESHRWLVLHYLTIGAISLMAALGYRSMGWAGLVGFWLPLLMPWASTRMYVSQTKTVITRNAELVDVNVKLEEANASLRRRIEEMEALYRVGIVLNRSLDLNEMLACIVNSVRDLTHAYSVAIFVSDKERRTLRLESQVGLSDEYLRQPEIALDGPAMRAIKEKRRFVADGEIDNRFLLSAAAAREGITSAACIPLTVGDEIVGAMDVAFKERHVFSDSEITVMETFAEQASLGIHGAQLNHQVHATYLSTIAVLVATVEAKDPYTRGHSERVRDLAISIGAQLRLAANELNSLEIAALFHDIGKIGIPEEVLGKNGPLATEEWQLVRRHPSLAENILKHVPALAETIPIIRAHHERPDGKGYPDGLIGKMPKLSAIIAVADSWDAMMSDRPYRKAMSRDYAISQLMAGAGTQFDPSVVDAFLKVMAAEDVAQTQIVIPEIKLKRNGFAAAAGGARSNAKAEHVLSR